MTAEQRITKRIWLCAFGTSPKSCFAGLQIRSERTLAEFEKKRWLDTIRWCLERAKD